MNWKDLPNVKFSGISYEGKSPTNVAWENYVKNNRKPLQWVADKVGKNKCWKVINAKWDIPKKALKFTLLVNADASREVDVSYEEICEELEWKSFKILGATSCVPVIKGMDEVADEFKNAINKTRTADKKWLKDHPEAAAELKNTIKVKDEEEK